MGYLIIYISYCSVIETYLLPLLLPPPPHQTGRIPRVRCGCQLRYGQSGPSGSWTRYLGMVGNLQPGGRESYIYFIMKESVQKEGGDIN